MIKSFLKAYKTCLNSYPLLTQSIQTGILMGVGDILEQGIIEKRPINDLNLHRTVQFSCVGLIVVGPALTTWYGFLNRRLGATGKAAVFKKVALDQLIFAPPFIVVVLTSLGISQRQSLEKTITTIKNNYFDILSTNYLLWPWVQLVNFCLVPLRYQVLLVQTVAIFWNTYLSYKTH